MADITIVSTPRSAAATIEDAQEAAARLCAGTCTQAARRSAAEPYFDLIELLFFAYRDFVGDPDEVLEKLGFGRAHHRVLHFVNRNPGMKVAELLDVLKITKQSLGRVLKQLIDEGYVVQKAGANDRRQRLLYATRRGRGAGDEACRSAGACASSACSPNSAPTPAKRRGAFSPA